MKMNNSNSNGNNSSGHSRNSNNGSTGHESINLGRRNSSISQFIADSKNSSEISEIIVDNNKPETRTSFTRVNKNNTIAHRDMNVDYKTLRYKQENSDNPENGIIRNTINDSNNINLNRFKNKTKNLALLNDFGKDSYSHNNTNKNLKTQVSTESFEVQKVDPIAHDSDMTYKSVSKEKSLGVSPQNLIIENSKTGTIKRKSDELEKTSNGNLVHVNINHQSISENTENVKMNNVFEKEYYGTNEEEENKNNSSQTIYKKQKKEHFKKILNHDSVGKSKNLLQNQQRQNIFLDPEIMFYNLEAIPDNLLTSLDNIREFKFYYGKIKSINLKSVLPPINLKVLKEIELKENLKNVQLRHDIVFDPFLQFKPNVDGERGLKKRKLEKKYWSYLLIELILLFKFPENFQPSHSLLHTMFSTLRDIMASLLKESELSNNNVEAVNIELVNLCENISPDTIVTDLYERKTFDIVHFADYLKFFLQRLCAPMRDPLIDKLHENLINSARVFESNEAAQDIKLFTGILNQFQFSFKILELMKLDVANHQIRLIRPALITNCVNFERQFFLQVVFPDPRFDKKSLVGWIYFPIDSNLQLDTTIMEKKSPIYWTNIFKTQNYEKIRLNMDVKFFFNNIYTYNVLRLLSCCMLTKHMPALLRYDVSRLCLLRSDLRECICLLIIKFLYKQLIYDDKTIIVESDKLELLKMYDTNMLKSEIVGIITDDSGAYRWTKNVTELALYLLNKIVKLKESLNINSGNSSLLKDKLSFTQNWLQKQIQPHSEVYQLLEFKVIKSIAQYVKENSQIDNTGAINMAIFESLVNNQNGATVNTASTNSSNNNNLQDSLFDIAEVNTLKTNLYQLISLNWSVINEKYAELLFDKVLITQVGEDN